MSQFRNQPLTPPDACTGCLEWPCVCDRWGDEIDRAYALAKGK